MYGAISVPTPKPVNAVRSEVREKISSGEIHVGREIAPKTVTTTKVSEEGSLVTINKSVYGRDKGLKDVVLKELDRLDSLHVLRLQEDQFYTNITNQVFKQEISRVEDAMIKLQTPEDLKALQRRFFLKIWHDHGSLLGASHMALMVQLMYDPATMMMQKEYEGSGKVQPLVERPVLCILARSGSSVADQALYSTPRVEDLDEIKQGIYFKNLHLHITPRFVVADYPARAFETGQQIGGNYKCPCGVSSHDHSNLEVSLSIQHQTLQEKTLCIKEGELWKKKNITIFKDLSKTEVVTEAKSRKLYTGTSYQPASKAEVSDQLTDHLKGIQRFPALLVNKKTSMNDVGCEILEVPECEILHDFVGVFENLMEEIPYHLEGDQREKCQQLFTELRSDKERLKGVDARRCAIRWALFCIRENMPRKITKVAQIMVEVSKIAYSYDDARTPRQVLRLHNLTFLLATTLVDVVGRVPSKLSQGKFYGIHFHGLTSHLPMVYRIVSLRGLVPEQEEAIFHKLRQVSLNTSSRKPQEVIDNAMVRVPFMYDDVNTRLYRESLISREGSKVVFEGAVCQGAKSKSMACTRYWDMEVELKAEVPLLPNTVLSKSMIGFKSHLHRIADFLNDGWVSSTADNSLLFYDSQQEPEVRPQGPALMHFRSSSLKSVEETLIRNKEALRKYCNFPSAAASPATNQKEYAESRPNFRRSALPSFITGKKKARR